MTWSLFDRCQLSRGLVGSCRGQVRPDLGPVWSPFWGPVWDQKDDVGKKFAHVIFEELRGPPEYHFNALQVPIAALKKGVGEDPKGALDGILKSEIGF